MYAIHAKRYLKPLLFVLSIICQLIVGITVSERTVGNVSLTLWFSSIILLYFSFPFFKTHGKVKEKFSSKTLVSLITIITFALILRISLMLNTNSFHIDEYLTAYFSYSLGNVTKLDWFGVYPSPGVWICQFPLLYFFFQKIFFDIFGLSTLTMRFSIVPYHLIIFLFLYLIGKRLFNKKTAFVAILLLSVFSPDLYLSKWSLHFMSSTALFLVSTYFFVLCIQEGKKIHFASFGFFLASCYATYYSSYIAAPLFTAYLLFLISTKRISKLTFMKFLFSVLIFFYALSPLIIYVLRVDNFLIQRTSQVAIINGTWSPYHTTTISPEIITNILMKQVGISVKSLYMDGIGGHAGYWFGRLALLDKITFLFFCIGILYFLFKTFKEKNAHTFFILATIVTAFIAGVVLTIPPPAFHRFSIAFPFIVLLISATIADMCLFFNNRHKKREYLLLIIFTCLLLIGNVLHFTEILKTDGPDDPDFPKIQSELTHRNVKTLYIAHFSSYSLQDVLFIRSNETITSITYPLHELLPLIPKNTPQYLVLVYPSNENIQIIKMAFPHTEVIGRYNTHMLLRVAQ